MRISLLSYSCLLLILMQDFLFSVQVIFQYQLENVGWV